MCFDLGFVDFRGLGWHIWFVVICWLRCVGGICRFGLLTCCLILLVVCLICTVEVCGLLGAGWLVYAS